MCLKISQKINTWMLQILWTTLNTILLQTLAFCSINWAQWVSWSLSNIFCEIPDGSVSRWLKRPLSGPMGSVPRERGGCSNSGERARQTNMALPFVHRQRGLKPSQSVRPNRSPKAAFSSEHFLPKGERWQIKVTSCSDTCLVSVFYLELLPCNNSFTCIHQLYSLAHLLAEMDIQC